MKRAATLAIALLTAAITACTNDSRNGQVPGVDPNDLWAVYNHEARIAFPIIDAADKQISERSTSGPIPIDKLTALTNIFSELEKEHPELSAYYETRRELSILADGDRITPTSVLKPGLPDGYFAYLLEKPGGTVADNYVFTAAVDLDTWDVLAWTLEREAENPYWHMETALGQAYQRGYRGPSPVKRRVALKDQAGRLNLRDASIHAPAQKLEGHRLITSSLKILRIDAATEGRAITAADLRPAEALQ